MTRHLGEAGKVIAVVPGEPHGTLGTRHNTARRMPTTGNTLARGCSVVGWEGDGQEIRVQRH
jgi:hypothetical protein